MDRRTWLAVVLCFVIAFAWQKFYIEPRMPAQYSAPAGNTAAPQVQSAAPPQQQIQPQSPTAKAVTPPSRSKVEAQTRAIKTETGDAVVSSGRKFFTGWNLKSYRLGLSSKAAAVDLKSVTHQDGEVELAFDDPELSYLNNVDGTFKETPQGLVWTHEDENVILTREFRSVENQPYLNLTIRAQFKNKHPKFAFLSLSSQLSENDPEANDRHMVYWTQDTIERHLVKDATMMEVKTPVKYIGVTSHYFIMTLVADGPSQPLALIQGPNAPAGAARISMVYPVAENGITIPTRVYFGPKELTTLRKVDPRLDHAVDFGWFTIFAYPLLAVLKWLYGFSHNYGIAIIILTLLLKIATYPLTYKSMKSMKEMQVIQPQLQRIREKYKDDKVRLNQEMLTLMKAHGYNPMAGCLPMLLQIPIFIALYNILRSSIELYHAPFAFWIHDLSAQDPFYVTPILLTLTMYIQQKLTPTTATDPAQQKMLQLMPVIFGFMMINLASGLTIYMLTNALAGIVQQLILNKKLHIQPHAPAALATRAR